MGEAKRRAAAYAAAKRTLLGSLMGDSLTVAETALTLFERFILPTRYTGGCYLTSMILHRYLKQERGIETDVVVGFINDGTDEIFISHGWLEHEGRKIDLTANITVLPEHRGPLLVLDQVLRPSEVTYTYHRERTPAGIAADMEMLGHPDLANIVRDKADEHRAMLAFASNPALMEAYVNSAPREQGYEAMTAALR